MPAALDELRHQAICLALLGRVLLSHQAIYQEPLVVRVHQAAFLEVLPTTMLCPRRICPGQLVLQARNYHPKFCQALQKPLAAQVCLVLMALGELISLKTKILAANGLQAALVPKELLVLWVPQEPQAWCQAAILAPLVDQVVPEQIQAFLELLALWAPQVLLVGKVLLVFLVLVEWALLVLLALQAEKVLLVPLVLQVAPHPALSVPQADNALQVLLVPQAVLEHLVLLEPLAPRALLVLLVHLAEMALLEPLPPLAVLEDQAHLVLSVLQAEMELLVPLAPLASPEDQEEHLVLVVHQEEMALLAPLAALEDQAHLVLLVHQADMALLAPLAPRVALEDLEPQAPLMVLAPLEQQVPLVRQVALEDREQLVVAVLLAAQEDQEQLVLLAPQAVLEEKEHQELLEPQVVQVPMVQRAVWMLQALLEVQEPQVLRVVLALQVVQVLWALREVQEHLVLLVVWVRQVVQGVQAVQHQQVVLLARQAVQVLRELLELQVGEGLLGFLEQLEAQARREAQVLMLEAGLEVLVAWVVLVRQAQEVEVQLMLAARAFYQLVQLWLVR